MIEAVDTTWAQTHGPFKFLVIDGECGLNSAEAKSTLKSQGIEVRPRAPQQHVRTIDRRTRILRNSMHTAEEQLVNEGIKVTFKQLLAHSTFAGNALISYGGATPYNARFGRQPAMLPDLHTFPETETARSSQRIREVALQKIIEATAIERVKRAEKTITTTPGEVLDFKPGDAVEFYRATGSKDKSGWSGPAHVLENLPARGLVRIKHKGQEMLVRYADVRRWIEFASLTLGYTTTPGSAASNVILVIERFLDRLPVKTLVTFGYVRQDGKWLLTAETRKSKQVAHALDYITRNILCQANVFAFRLGRGIAKFPHCPSASTTKLFWWKDDFDDFSSFASASDAQVNTSMVVGETWPTQRYMQMLITDDADYRYSDVPQ